MTSHTHVHKIKIKLNKTWPKLRNIQNWNLSIHCVNSLLSKFMPYPVFHFCYNVARRNIIFTAYGNKAILLPRANMMLFPLDISFSQNVNNGESELSLCCYIWCLVDGQEQAWPFSNSITGFWPSYCQISTDLDKIVHTPVVVRNTPVGWLRPWSACGWIQAKPRFRRHTVKVKVRTGAVMKISGIFFVAWAEPDPKTAFSPAF